MRPNAYEALALTTELRRRFKHVAGAGIAPAISRLWASQVTASPPRAFIIIQVFEKINICGKLIYRVFLFVKNFFWEAHMGEIRIDTHCHGRDGNQSDRGTIAEAFQLADRAGIKYLFDMAANTNPPTLNSNDVRKRMLLCPQEYRGRYFLWVGLTVFPLQIVRAVQAYNDIERVVGLKMFTCESGSKDLVVDTPDQPKIYRALVEFGFEGVLAVHCEKVGLLKPELWNPQNPISHSLARPKEAEIESVREQIAFASNAGFGIKRGTLYFCHLTCPESVGLVAEARKNGIKVACEVTPHHLLYVDAIQRCEGGISYKTNPPLRSLDDVRGLQMCVANGEIDCFGTDHAPHGKRKMQLPYPSGFPSLTIYREVVDNFLPNVLGVSQEVIDAMTYGNIVKIFGPKIGGLI